jgi:membrane-associated phospholipid phosphatase
MKYPEEEVYALSWKKDIPLASAAIGLTITHVLMDKDHSVSPEYIMGLNPSSVNDFDASATRQFSSSADKASDFFLFSAMASPVLLMADPAIRKDWKEVSIITLETYLIGLGLVSLSKNLVDRPRPIAFNKKLSVQDRAESGTRNSFMSGHTSATAMSTFMMATILTDYHPDSRWKPLIWILAAGLPLTTGMLRYKAGKHYFTDVIAGYAVGALTGFAVPRIHKRIKTRIMDKQSQITELF